MKTLITCSVMLFLGLNSGFALEPGDKAPDFNLKDADGKEYKLSDYTGQIVAIYFYPKDDTPGCTRQACSIRDGYGKLKEKGITVLGISYDNSDSHSEFAEKHNLNFPLLSDTDKAVSKAYGVDGFFFAKRWTFIIDEKGIVSAVIKKVDTDDHASQILSVVKEK